MTNTTKKVQPAGDASVKVVGKAGQILRVFLDDGPELQLREIAEISGLDMSTTSRIVASLTAIGVLRFDKIQRVYTPGLMLLELSKSVLERFGLRELIHRELAAMSTEHGWNCYVGVPDEKASGQLDFIDATRVRPQAWVPLKPGQRRDARQSASGLTFLAYGVLDSSCAFEDADEAQSFEETLAKVRSEGYAERVHEGVIGVAVPIWGNPSQVVATFGIELDLDSFLAGQNAVLSAMRAKARGLSSAIGLAGFAELRPSPHIASAD